MASQFELTLSEVLSDPLILSVALADGWSKAEFRNEMTAAARELTKRSMRASTLAPSVSYRTQPVGGSCACCA